MDNGDVGYFFIHVIMFVHDDNVVSLYVQNENFVIRIDNVQRTVMVDIPSILSVDAFILLVRVINVRLVVKNKTIQIYGLVVFDDLVDDISIHVDNKVLVVPYDYKGVI